MTLQQVMDFLAVAQHGSLHAAARSTGQSQPALTKSLNRLERDLGAPLFDRHVRGMQANEFGKRFTVHARRLLAEADRARESVTQLLGERLGRVQFGISVAASLLLAPAAIQRFRQQYAEVELRSRSGLYHVFAPLLRDGQLDFAICPQPEGVPDPQLSMRRLLESQMVLVARRDHPQARVRSLAALRHASFSVAAPSGQPGGGIYQAFEQAGLGQPHIELHTDGLIDTAAFVAGSDCLALMPVALMRSGLLRERLAVVPVADELPHYTVGLFQRSTVPLTPAAEELAAQFEREAAYLARAQAKA